MMKCHYCNRPALYFGPDLPLCFRHVTLNNYFKLYPLSKDHYNTAVDTKNHRGSPFETKNRRDRSPSAVAIMHFEDAKVPRAVGSVPPRPDPVDRSRFGGSFHSGPSEGFKR